MYALIDCNNFFASCEKVFDPKLVGVPLIVLSNNDGCVIARSAEAKALGIAMCAPFHEIRRTVEWHRIKVFSANFSLYSDMSTRVMATLAPFARHFEQYSVDEAFLEIPDMPAPEALEFARKLRTTVLRHTGLATGVGVAPTKALAKVANGLAKGRRDGPDTGLFVMPADEAGREAVLDGLRTREVWGVGAGMEKRLAALGALTALDLARLDLTRARRAGGVTLEHLVLALRGMPVDVVAGADDEPESRASALHSRTFEKEITDPELVRSAVCDFAIRAMEKVHSEGLCAAHLTVFLRGNRFRTESPPFEVEASAELPHTSADPRVAAALAGRLVEHLLRDPQPVKRAGVLLLGLTPMGAGEQTALPGLGGVEPEKSRALLEALDKIAHRHGAHMVRPASSLREGVGRSGHRSPGYTTDWSALPVAKA
jgi:DNA polymerase V